MLSYVLFELSLFSPGDNPREARKDLGWLLEALTQRNQAYLKENPKTPPLYKSGVVYERPAQFLGEDPDVAHLRLMLGPQAKEMRTAAILQKLQAILGGERFRDYGKLLANGVGDCDNLATARAAELRQKGIAAMPYLTWRQRLMGGTTYHALVVWPHMDSLYIPPRPDRNGGTEDPSLLLGMSQPERKHDRDEEIRKNLERCEILRARKGGRRVQPALVDDAVTEIERLLGRAA